MDWKAAHFDWNRVRAFLVTAEEGSLSAAARALGSTQPTIGRQVTRLEEELGVALFERIGTRLELTPTGLNLVEQARAMGESAMKLSLAAAGHSQTIEGTVSITASEAIATYLLPPVIHQLRREHPKIEIEIVASNESQDLHRREADIAVRNYAPKHDDLIGRKVGVSLGKFYATPAYIEEFGPFEKPEDLSRGEIFAFDRSEMMISWLCGMGWT